jgi:hypothetical protein
MVIQRATLAVTMIAALAFVSAGAGPASAHSKHVGRHRAHARTLNPEARYVSGHVRARLTSMRRPSHYAALVGDSGSGLGFYPLPWRYRIGAWRYRQRRAMQTADAMRAAIASTAIYSNAYYPFGYGYGFGHHHGVFNPIDGVGTPFFAGYYGGGGGLDEPPPPPPFGSPDDY